MKRDRFTRDRDDMTIGERVAAAIAGGFFAVAFMVAAVVQSVWGDDGRMSRRLHYERMKRILFKTTITQAEDHWHIGRKWPNA